MLREQGRRRVRPQDIAVLDYIVFLIILALIPGGSDSMRPALIEGPIGGERVQAIMRMHLWLSVNLRDPSSTNTARERGLLRKRKWKGFSLV